jgi:hypothetical protein
MDHAKIGDLRADRNNGARRREWIACALAVRIEDKIAGRGIAA